MMMSPQRNYRFAIVLLSLCDCNFNWRNADTTNTKNLVPAMDANGIRVCDFMVSQPTATESTGDSRRYGAVITARQF